jgi:hypothetical protein
MKFADAVLAQAQEKVHGDEFAVYVASPPLSPITK